MDQQRNGPAVPGFLPPPAMLYPEVPRSPSTPHEEHRGDKLATRIARVVKRRTAGSVQNLRVEVRRDGVFLDGQCATFYTKQLAQQAAMDLADEQQLTNRIEVL